MRVFIIQTALGTGPRKAEGQPRWRQDSERQASQGTQLLLKAWSQEDNASLPCAALNCFSGLTLSLSRLSAKLYILFHVKMGCLEFIMNNLWTYIKPHKNCQNCFHVFVKSFYVVVVLSYLYKDVVSR